MLQQSGRHCDTVTFIFVPQILMEAEDELEGLEFAFKTHKQCNLLCEKISQTNPIFASH